MATRGQSQRRVGLTKTAKLGYTLLQSIPTKVAPKSTPVLRDVDVNADPLSSDDGDRELQHESDVSSGISDTAPARSSQKRKREEVKISARKQPKSDSDEEAATASGLKSRIRATTFRNGEKPGTKTDSAQSTVQGEPDKSVAWEAQRLLQKGGSTYGKGGDKGRTKGSAGVDGKENRNIHGSTTSPDAKSSKSGEGRSTLTKADKSRAFKDYGKDFDELEQRAEQLDPGPKFRIPESTPKKQKKQLKKKPEGKGRGTRSSARVKSEPSLPSFKRPSSVTSPPPARAFVVPPDVCDGLDASTNPGLIHNSKDASTSTNATTFIIASSNPTAFSNQDDSSSISSLSSSPTSPELNATIHHSISLSSFIADIDLTAKSPEPQPLESNRCPICSEIVTSSDLEDFKAKHNSRLRNGQLPWKLSKDFHKRHKQESAKRIWNEKGYPKIIWPSFARRLASHKERMREIVELQRPSYYRARLWNSIRSDEKRSAVSAIQILQTSIDEGLTGYYGTRGARVMMDYLTNTFANQLRQLALTDELITSVGVGITGYTQSVLLPELAVALVQEDMSVDEESARQILKDTTELGELVNEEEEDVVESNVEVENGGSYGIPTTATLMDSGLEVLTQVA
ncbi:hypothetical protein MMC25_002824 [Agyrium rufum]|nr:hypothetical protein [Agyrium rufum]